MPIVTIMPYLTVTAAILVQSCSRQHCTCDLMLFWHVSTSDTTTHCCPAGYAPPRLLPARSSSPLSIASDEFDPDPAQQQLLPSRAASSPADAIGQEGIPQQAAPQQPRAVSGSFSSMSVEKGVSSGSTGLADGIHHQNLQVCLLNFMAC